MYKVTHLVHLADKTDELAAKMTIERLTAAGEFAGAKRIVVSPTLPGVRNGGDIIAHFQFPSKAEWVRRRPIITEATAGPAIEHTDSAEYAGGSPSSGRTGSRTASSPPTVYRTLLLRVDDTAVPAAVHRFEQATLQMPEHIPAIRAWQLSQIDRAGGTTQWTHVWEQEFTDTDGLFGPYMHHPIHWALVDQWFDPESPEQIVKDRICHSFCAIPAPVIDPAPEPG
ncbi:Dabb family protein [Nocardia sp. NPDC003963]